jgi:NADH-quinone oxidoreductase subunit N
MVAPMAIVALTGIIVLIIEMFRSKKDNNLLVGVSIAGLIIAGVTSLSQIGYGDIETANRMIVRDSLTCGLQIVLVLGTAITIAFSEGYLRDKRISHGEFYPLILWSTAGAMLMVSTKHLLVMFLGLEILSVALYVLAGMSRTEEKSEESALKYFLLGAFASGFFLYGIAFVYGATGSLHLDDVMYAYQHRDAGSNAMLLFGLALMFIGLAFKASLVPFHLWTPDVYQGAPTNVTSYMASGSKVAAFGAMTRVLEAFTVFHSVWVPAVTLIAVLTMTYGNVVALRQKDVKRMLGYSSIANAGYLVVALVARSTNPLHVGSATIVYYLLAYSLTTIGAFCVVTVATRGGKEGTQFSDLNGLYQRSPLAAIALTVIAASLMGIPGTGGFIGKLLIVKDAYQANLTVLWVFVALNSIVSLAYYLKLIFSVYAPAEPSADARLAKLHPGAAWACAICVGGVVGFGVFASPVLHIFTNH